MADDLELRIARLNLEGGDVLVVQSDRPIPRDVLANLLPPGVRVLHIPTDVNLSVLTKAEIESRATGNRA